MSTDTTFQSLTRLDAWHKVGHLVSGDMTAAEALEAGQLAGWNVRKIALTATELTADGFTNIEVPNRYATVFSNPVTGKTEYLGVVGSHYQPIQNEENTELLDAVRGESGGRFEVVGHLKGGKETFIGMKLPDTIMVGGEDPVDTYLYALNSHDGQSQFRFFVSPIRIRCKNQLRAAIKGATATFSVRHNGGASAAIVEAREALGLTMKYLDTFQEEANRMLDQAMTDLEFERIMGQLFAADTATTTRQKNVAARHLEGVTALWTQDEPLPGAGVNTMSGIKGTRWGAYQALTEYTDHYMDVRAKDPELARATRALTSQPIAELKLNAFRTLATV